MKFDSLFRAMIKNAKLFAGFSDGSIVPTTEQQEMMADALPTLRRAFGPALDAFEDLSLVEKDEDYLASINKEIEMITAEIEALDTGDAVAVERLTERVSILTHRLNALNNAYQEMPR